MKYKRAAARLHPCGSHGWIAFTCATRANWVLRCSISGSVCDSTVNIQGLLMDNEHLTLCCCAVLPRKSLTKQSSLCNKSPECWYSPVLWFYPLLRNRENNWQHSLLLAEMMQYVRDEEITRKQDGYADFSFLVAFFSCTEKYSPGRCLEQTPFQIYFFKRAAMVPALCWTYRRFTGITCWVQLNCNIIFFQSQLKVKMTLSGVPADCLVAPLIITQILSITNECLMALI